MSEIKQLALNARYGHATIGSVSAFAGKSFVKDAVGATSCEISYGSLAPGEAVPFLHSHKANEEHYLILSVMGCFQVDDDILDISEGSVVRVATGAQRCLRNTDADTMVYVCIQAPEGGLTQWTMTDGIISDTAPAL